MRCRRVREGARREAKRNHTRGKGNFFHAADTLSQHSSQFAMARPDGVPVAPKPLPKT